METMTKDEEFVQNIVRSVYGRIEYHRMRGRQDEAEKRRMDATEFIKYVRQWKQ